MEQSPAQNASAQDSLRTSASRQFSRNHSSAFNPESQLPPLCRVRQLLTVLPIGRSTVFKWVEEGRFPAPIKLGGCTVWRREDVLAWLAEKGR